jgi:hypothetical protein
MNDSQLFYKLIRNVTVAPGTGAAPFVGDVGIAGTRGVRADAGGPAVRVTSRISDLGDLRVFGALETIDGTGLTVAPRGSADVAVGATIALPEKAPPGSRTIQTGDPADLLLLKPTGDGRYRVERILRSDEVMGGPAS